MIEGKVAAFLAKHSFKMTGKRIAVGVSGGPDSLALLHFLAEKRAKWRLHLVALHVDHMFRGQESYEDALFVRRFCQQNEIPVEIIRANVPAYIEKSKKNSQLAAREVRYQFFSEMMAKHQLDCLALAHHGDDQIETVLMRLTRGSSEKARAGIPFRRPFANGTIIRPFLCLTKEELESYCQQHQLKPRRDPSNEKEDYSRNRFRKHVLPFLKKENPLVHEHFQRFSEELAADEQFLFELTRQEMNKVMKRCEDKITIEVEAFLAMPMPLQRRGIKLILSYLYREQTTSLSAIHTENIEALIRNPHPSGSLDFPNGLKVIRSYGSCHFELHPQLHKPYYYELDGPGQVSLPNGCQIRADYLSDEAELPQGDESFLINTSEISFPLIIRTRRPGDRMTIKGMDGTRKLKNIFIDEKIPLKERDQWPVITDSADQILWLPKLKKSSYTAVHANKNKIMVLTFMQ